MAKKINTARQEPPNTNTSGSATPKGTKASARSNNTRFILAAIAALLLLSAIQFLLLFTVTDEKLKPLDPKTKIQIEVVQVIDLDFSFFSEAEFQEILTNLGRDAQEKLGYELVFTQGRKIISDEYANPHDVFTDPKTADTWFSSQLAVSKGWQTNFAWLGAIMQQPASRRILESYYNAGEGALNSVIRRDFTEKIARHLEIRDMHGSPVFSDKRQQGLSSSAYWHYLLGKQADGDLVICNIPIVFPSALTPADAVTRGGLLTSMLAPSSRPLGGVAGLSCWPILAAQYPRKTALEIFERMALQALARLLHRQGYALQPEGNLLYPMLGEDYLSWYTHGTGRLAEDRPQPVKSF